jgi:DNA-binding response OmpR family regulator
MATSRSRHEAFAGPQRISHRGCLAWLVFAMTSGTQALRATSAAAVGVTVVAVEGAPSIALLIQDLTREVLDVDVASMDLLNSELAPERQVFLFWMPPGLAPAFFERVVGWSERHQPRPGLLGCVPGGSPVDSEIGLAAGFDDFVAGACSTRELAARVRAVHRRVHWPGLRRPGRLRFGSMTLNTDGHELWLEGKAITLTGTELSVFRALMRAQGRTLSRGELLDHAWGEGNLEISERAVDNVILRLRRKLSRPNLIQTVRGVGFRLADE